MVKSLVELSLSQATDNITGKESLHKILHPVKKQIKGQPIVCNAVQNPGSPSSAQVKLGREDMVVSHYGTLDIFSSYYIHTYADTQPAAGSSLH